VGDYSGKLSREIAAAAVNLRKQSQERNLKKRNWGKALVAGLNLAIYW
jgi:hypothetical protein